MRLEKIYIQHFRSIQQLSVKIENNICALVGENNAGKSAVLRALNAFFNYEEEVDFFQSGDHHFLPSHKIQIELTFSDIPAKPEYTNRLNAPDELILKLEYTAKNGRKIKYKKSSRYNEIREVSQFLDFLKKDIYFMLIPPSRDYNNAIWSENALLKKVLVGYFESRKDTLTSKVKPVTTRFEKEFEKITKKLDSYYFMNGKQKFEIKYSRPDYHLLLTDLSMKVVDRFGKSVGMVNSGSGIQSIASIALYNYLAHSQYSNLIIGIEEPETNLHPQAQREFIKTLYNKVLDENTQLVITTHSTAIVDQLEHNDIVLIKKVKDKDRDAYISVGTQISSDFWTINNIDKEKYRIYHKYNNSEFFFARFVVIVESHIDAEVVRTLLEKYGIDVDLLGITLLNVNGIGNLKYAFHMVKNLRIPYLVIVDKDFFFNYANNQLSLSRDANGLPIYNYTLNRKRTPLINEMITRANDRADFITQCQSKNHFKALDVLEKYGIVSFNYAMETDLVSVDSISKIFYKVLNITKPSEKTKNHLLTQRMNAVKDMDNLIAVLKEANIKSLPISFSRIKRIILESISRT